MSKYYITSFEIEEFLNPGFDTETEAEAWISLYIDNLDLEDHKRGIHWDSVSWRVTERE